MRDRELNRLFERYRRQRDPRALAEVFDATAPELYRVAMHVVRDPGEADDLLQATFLTAIERAEAFDGERRLVPWLVGILVNHARSARRRRRRTGGESALANAAAAGLDPSEAAQSLELSAELRSAIARLPDAYRDVLRAYLEDGRRAVDIAHASGDSPGTVRSRIHRGLELLRRALPAGAALGLAVDAVGGRGFAAIRAEVVRAAGERAVVPPSPNAPGAGAASSNGAGAAVSLAAHPALAAVVAALLIAAVGWFALEANAERSGDQARASDVAQRAVADRAGALNPVDDAGLVATENAAARRLASDPRAAASTPVAALKDDGSADRIRGRLLDAVTGDAVPYVELSVVQLDRRVETRTDADGRFAARLALDPSVDAGRFPLRLELRDELVQPPFDATLERGGAERTFRVRATPTFVLELVGDDPIDAGGCLARIVSSNDFKTDRCAIRVEPTTWTRIGPASTIERLEPPWRIEVQSSDGRAGSVRLPRLLGHGLTPIRVELVEAGTLGGKLVDARGDAVAWSTRATLLHRDTQGRERELGRSQGASFLRDDVPLGPGTLVVRATGYDAASVPVDVQADRVGSVTVVLARPRPAGRVAGHVLPPPLRPDGPFEVVLQQPAVDRERVQLVERASSFAFAFDDVPEGPCSLELRAPKGERAAQGWLDLVAPAENVALEAFDGAAVAAKCTWTIRARDAETGEPIPEVRSSLADPGTTMSFLGRAAAVDELALGFPCDHRFRWAADADGYRAVYGDEGSFQPDGADGRTCEVVLERGWGRRIRVVDEHLLPIAGVAVRLDGELVGTSDARGLLEATRDDRPARVSVDGAWLLAEGGSLEPTTGAFADPFPEIVVVVAPR